MSFEARYPGVCGACDEPVTPGQECAYSPYRPGYPDVIVHSVCPTPPAPRPICDDCFTEYSVSGACSC